MKKLIISAAFALASAALVGTSASAAVFNDGDLLLNFRLSNSTSSPDLEIDLGAASSFSFTQNNNVFSTLGNDLGTVFGTNWNQNTNLVYSLVSYNSTSGNFYVSDPGNSTNLSTSIAANAGKVDGLYSESSALTGDTALGSGAYKIVLSQTSPSSVNDPFQYTDVLLNVNSDNGPTPYGATNQYDFLTFNSEQNVTKTGTAMNSSLDLYEMTPGAGGRNPVPATSTDLGTFTLESNGTLVYGVVPEPSTYALFGLGAVALLFARRRFMKA